MSVGQEEALREAAVYGQSGLVQHLAEECGADVNATDEYGYTALMHAAQHGNIDVVHYLVSQCGAHVNAANNSHDTALMKAAANGHLDVVQYLVGDCRAKLKPRNRFKPTPLTWAARNDHVDVVQFLVGADTSFNNMKCRDKALVTAAQFGHIDLCLVEQFNADANVKNDNGSTPLMMASRRGHIDIVRYLTGKCGVDVNSKNKHKATTLMETAAFGHIDIVRYLIACGADVNAKDEDGDTAVRRAADHGYHDIQRILYPLITVFLAPEQPPDLHGRSGWIASFRERFHRFTKLLQWPRIHPPCTGDTTGIDTNAVLDSYRSSSCSIPPTEIELTRFCQNGSDRGVFKRSGSTPTQL
ncbi:hypothetical protein ON010_g17994 [Phytophthora cinnamomi]|nr:hypothetical protein ON010_g17994 [Phytophthora cinnamomi]